MGIFASIYYSTTNIGMVFFDQQYRFIFPAKEKKQNNYHNLFVIIFKHDIINSQSFLFCIPYPEGTLTMKIRQYF